MSFAFGPAWRLKTASLAVQISLVQDWLAAPGAASCGPRTPTAAIFQDQEQTARECWQWPRWGHPYREGEAPPAVGVLRSFRAPPNEFQTENLILLELSLENQSNYFLLPFVEYSYNCITVNGVRINT